MIIIKSQAELAENLAGQKVLKKEAMTPSFEGVNFTCGCGEHHVAKNTPHVACGTLNEFFHQCQNRYVTLVKYKGIFRVSARERWSCPADIFWGFVEGKRDLSDDDIETAMVQISHIIAETADVSVEEARTYANDFKSIYLENVQDGEEPEFAVAWGAILHISKIADLDNPQSQFLASRAPTEYSSPISAEITRKISLDAVSKFDGDMKAAVQEALEKVEKQEHD